MSVGSVLVQPTVVNAQYPERKAGEKQGSSGKPLTQEEMFLLANTPDSLLEGIARHEAYKDYNEDPTRNITSAVGGSIPFVDSFMRGALQEGSAGTKVARAVSTGADWGIFTGAVWLYNKALKKVYDNVPGLRKFKEEHPGVTFAGEVGSAVLVGQGAISGYHAAVKKLTKGKEPMQLVAGWLANKPKLAENVAKVFTPVENFAKKHPKVMQYGGLGIFVTMAGLILKNIFDVHNTKVQADERVAELKDQRYQATKTLLDQYAQAGKA